MESSIITLIRFKGEWVTLSGEIYPLSWGKIYSDGTVIRINNLSEELDSQDDLPSVVTIERNRFWYKNGVLHRDGDLPAVIKGNGLREYYKNGLLHRDGDLPARIHEIGDKYWYKNGSLHRDGDLLQ